MKTIVNKPWDYTFIEKNMKHYLSVMCGSVAIFEINIELTEEECALYEQKGLNYIEELARRIQHSPSLYKERALPDNSGST